MNEEIALLVNTLTFFCAGLAEFVIEESVFQITKHVDNRKMHTANSLPIPITTEIAMVASEPHG